MHILSFALIILIYLLIKLYQSYKYDQNINLGFNDLRCNKYFVTNAHLFDTSKPKIFSDYDIREKLFTNFKRVYSVIPINDVILDIGSNIGDVTEILNKCYKNNRIFLAEPLLLNYIKTKERFNLSKNIYTINTAIGYDSNKVKWKHYNPGDMFKFPRILKNRNELITNISFVGLDSFYYKYVKTGNIFFLKIDVEGYEDEVLFTGKEILSNEKTKFVYFEYHKLGKTFCKTECSTLIVYLEGLGFHCYLLGKHRMIRITKGCFAEIDSRILPHVVGIKDTNYLEHKLIDAYNSLINI